MPRRRYQGAIVRIWNRGLFIADPTKDLYVRHVDVGGMYPTGMAILNLSSENMKLISKEPYTGKFEFNYNDGVIEIPDGNLNAQIRMSVGREDSITRKFMLEFRALRNEMKKIKGAVGQSSQRGVKLVMNSTYGYHGLEFSRYGSFLVAIATAGFGRYVMRHIIKHLGKFDDVTKIECDTDGLYYYGLDHTDSINAMLADLFADYPLRHLLAVNLDNYDGMISYSMKNYVLRRNDVNKFKGSAFHGRNMPNICKIALEAFADALFTGKSTKAVWQDFHDMRSYPLKEFTMSVQFAKKQEDYDESTMYKQLADQLQDYGDMWGQDIYYVKTVRGYRPLGVVGDKQLRRELDTKYYIERIRNVVSRLTEAKRKVTKTQVRKGGRTLIADGSTNIAEFM